MNKQFKFFLTSAAIAAALVGAVSCQKDYSGDIDDLNKKVNELTTKLGDLQSKIDNGEIVTGVTPIAGGIQVKTNKGTYDIVGQKGDKGDNGAPGSVVTIDAEGYWCIDGKRTDPAIKAKGDDGDTIYYIPNADGYFYKVVNGAEPEKTDISFLAPGTVTAVYDPEAGTLSFYNVQGYEGAYVLSLSSKLKSLVFVPQAYVEGVEAMLLETLSYKAITIKDKDNKAGKEIGEEAKTASVVSVPVVAQYYLNPANADTTGLKFNVVTEPNVEYAITRATASEDFKVEVEGWELGKHQGRTVINVKLNVTGTPAVLEAEDPYLSVVALEAVGAEGDVVVSDYATLYKKDLAALRIADVKAEAKKKGIATGEEHYRRVMHGVNVAADPEAYNKHAVWETATDLKASKVICDTTCAFDGELDLTKIVEAHAIAANPSQEGHTVQDISKLGLEWKFELVKNYVIGTPETDQIHFVKESLIKDGKFVPTVYEIESKPIAAVGRTPIIRVSIINPAKKDEIVEAAYIKVFIEGPGAKDEEIELNVGTAEFDCVKDAELSITVEQMNKAVYQKVGYSHDDFHKLFKLNPNYKDEKAVGTVTETPNDETQGTNVLTWTISADDLWKAINAGQKSATHTVQYINETTGATVTLTLVADIAGFQLVYNVPEADYIPVFWMNEPAKNITYYNVFTPDEGETDPSKCIFLTDINISFKTWTTGDKDEDGKQLGTLGVLKLSDDTNGNVTSIDYFFCKEDVEAIKTIGDIPVKFEVVDETKLFATVKIDGKDVREQIAEINNEAITLSTNGLNAPNSISLIKNDVSKLLVNTNDLHTFIGAKGYICGETEKSVTIKFQNQDHFQAKFVRPVNIDPVAADYFVDALDFGEPHTFIRLEDLINPYDWRNRHFVAPYENYWEYYGIEKIEVVDDNILWDAEGSKSAKPENIVVKADYDTKEMGSGANKKTSKFGFLTYRNGNAYAKSFNFYVKVRVTYTWGVIETTEVVVNVRETIGDVD